jgi:acyl-CoA dehydrogenase
VDLRHFQWPFLTDAHVTLAARAETWIAQQAHVLPEARDIDDACRDWVAGLGAAGFLRYCVPAAYGGALQDIDSRALCVLREVLAYHDALADFSFAMQGLGSAAMALGEATPTAAQWLPRVARGEAIAAFALSEPDAGSDAAALTTTARREGAHWVIDGCKTWISNGGIADFYCVFARTNPQGGTHGISAFVVPADAPGLVVAERIRVIAPHPLARVLFENCRVPLDHLLGVEGEGFRLAMRVLDVFRASVGAAAVGLARRALDAAVAHMRERRMFGATLADRDIARATLGDMATQLDAATLLVYRAAWMRDVQSVRTTAESAMAKLDATEAAQRIIDAAVQLHGGLGVTVGQVVERLYREIRALRIYEGATEVQKLVIGKAVIERAGGMSR